MSPVGGAKRRITDEVTSWPGVHATTGRRGEWSFRVGAREIGHLHGDYAAHFGFPKHVWRALYAQGRIDYHPAFPLKEGWGARGIESEADVADVIAMLRMNYDRVVERHGLPEDAREPRNGRHAQPLTEAAAPPE
ncbi:MAG TPA: luciferase family protein [Solirubrobacterales bacterium]